MNKNIKKIALLMGLLIVVILLWVLDVFQYFSIDRLSQLTEFINGFGWLAPVVFIVTYIVATIFFLPGLPLTLLAGVIFGPVFGSIWVSVASTIGATGAFIVGRYLGRDFVAQRFSKNDLLLKLDQGVKREGWKMVAITRLVPLFPFNAQNYVYGLTDIPLTTYVLVSWICMLPATIAYVFLAGAIIEGQGNVGRTFVYIGIGVALILILTMIKKAFDKKQLREGEGL